MTVPTSSLPPDRPALLRALVALAGEAGDIVWDHFVGGCAVSAKADESPVTAADHEAEAAILAGLAVHAPGVPVVAEEEAAAGRVPATGACFFLVDPLDGTREFVARGDDFTVNIGLIEDGAPTLGVVYAPARSALYWGDTAAGEAWQAKRTPHGQTEAAERITVRTPVDPPCAVASRNNGNPPTLAWLAASGATECVSIGSSLKFVLIASGEADVYPRPAPTMEWDTAAGDAVLRAAGGRVLDCDGAALAYGKPRFFNPGFLATGRFDPLPLRPFLA
ncbi:3'(2'),5'-bisphosphate nucleotidase CysQ [Sphingomonas bacterium]|uniref:3'(2'),5'-bisphosphate nucleotidase CysQ n=1 Tax=Sphingomonas bacterium TaxID=1895847 RepID=UPI00157525CA|nr:3'(2'),5'-bisphosphate nucleotidase CysQ [Sphingomonas bacterium]